MMTYKELFEKVCALEPRSSVSLDLETWRHRHEDMPPTQKVEWVIYVAERREHFRGTTPEEAYAAMVKAYTTGSEPVEVPAVLPEDVPEVSAQ